MTVGSHQLWTPHRAVSLPQNNQSSWIKDVTIARLIVGKRHGAVS
ncbi:hypothetical protein [Microcoleus sp. AR_TQ3_B6]